MLYSQWPRLFTLKQTLSFSYAERPDFDIEDTTLEQEGGLWGCRNSEGWIIPPLYDGGFEPTEGFMVTSLGGYTHLLSIAERRVVHSFAKGITAKPVKDGAIAIRDGSGQRQNIPLDILL